MLIAAGFMGLVFAALLVDVLWLTPRQKSHPEHRRRRTDAIERTNEIIASAAWHRERMEALHAEICELHGYSRDSGEGDELGDVVFSGEPYTVVMERIMKRYRTPNGL